MTLNITVCLMPAFWAQHTAYKDLGFSGWLQVGNEAMSTLYALEGYGPIIPSFPTKSQGVFEPNVRRVVGWKSANESAYISTAHALNPET